MWHWLMHDWHFVETYMKTVREPKCGPFDPRTEDSRISEIEMEKYICCLCGKQKERRRIYKFKAFEEVV